MTADNFQIVATHFSAEFEHYGVTAIDTKKNVIESRKLMLGNTHNAIINFAIGVEQMESQRGKASHTIKQVQHIGENTEYLYETVVDPFGEHLTTTVYLNSRFYMNIKPCDITRFRAAKMAEFERFSFDPLD